MLRRPERETIGRYALRAVLGSGGFATVYRAHDPRRGHDVALKVLHGHLTRDHAIRSRFLREARALRQVQHRNVVTVLDAGEGDGHVYVAMDLVEGRSLATVLRDRGALPLDEVVAIAGQLAEGLTALHAAKLIHRDIKPANVIVETATSRAVLLDLGAARALDAATITTSTVIGTPAYMAPEQLDPDGVVGPRTDVYQLGATVYALLTGHAPFEGDQLQVINAIAVQQPPAITTLRHELPPRVAEVLARALAKLPEYRHAGPRAFASALHAAAGAPPVTTEPTVTVPLEIARRVPVPAVAQGTAAVKRSLWVAVLLGSALLLAGIAILPRLGDAEADPPATATLAAEAPPAGAAQLGNATEPAPAAVAAATGTATAPPAALLVEDDFENPARGVLPRTSAEPASYQVGYEGGEYVVRKLDQSPLIAGASVPGAFTDTTVAVDVRLAGDPQDRFVVLVCRYGPSGDYRLVLNPAAGTFLLGRSDGDTVSPLADWQPSPAIQPGTGLNRLGLTCTGNTIAAEANGVPLAVVQDTTLRSGQVLLGIGRLTAGAGPSEGRFDNLRVR